MNKKNIESVNNAILMQIEKGGFIPWVKDWASDFGKYSAVSKKPYSFLNSILLKHGGAYASFEQWKSRGFIPEKNTAEYVYFFKLYNPKTREIVETEDETENDGIIAGALYITDGDLNFMVMPLRAEPENAIKPEAISAEDVEKARKYKVYLEGKAGKYANSEYYLDDKNVILKRKEFFVVIPKYNEFFARVFNMPKDESEYNEINESDTAGLFEVDPEQHKNTEDLFHKKVAYFKNITHGNFWHFYENGTGVCFNNV